jgi:hypothetical protein
LDVSSRENTMGRIDDEAAERELRKAADFTAKADQLVAIARDLRTSARQHLREAEELRGRGRKRTRR